MATRQIREREHITEGTTCWCSPVVDSYGADDDADETLDDEGE